MEDAYIERGADFWVGVGREARWIGSLGDDGAPPLVDIFRPSHGHWDADVFSNAVGGLVLNRVERGEIAVWTVEADARPIAPGRRARWAYVLVPHSGCVHVFRDGYLIEQRYPKGSRKATALPVPGVADA